MLAVCPYAICAARPKECRETYLLETGKNERSNLEEDHEL